MSNKMSIHISHLAQDLAPGLSRADFYRCNFKFQERTRLQLLSIVASAYVGAHPCRILQAFPVQQVPEGFQRDESGTFSFDYVYDNGVQLDLKTIPKKTPPSLDLYVKVDATHSESVEIRFEARFRLAVDSFYRVSHPNLWNLPTQLTGSLRLKAVQSPLSSGPSTPREEFNRRLWKETRQVRKPSVDNSAALTMVDEEVHIVDHEEEVRQGKLGWQIYTNNLRLDMAPTVPAK